MAVQRFKTEDYALLGGINSKVSPYLNTPLEFLDILNYDFQTPGALSQSWGSTQYVGQTFSGKITALYEYVNASGFSQIIIGHSGGLWAGATTGDSQGLSLTNVGASFVSFLEIKSKTGNNSMTSSDFYLFGEADKLSGPLSGDNSSAFSLAPQFNSSNNMSFVSYDDWVFMADGTKFIKYNGVSTYMVGLPPVTSKTAAWGATINSGGTIGFGLTVGFLALYGSYVNNRGYEGPIWPIGTIGFSGLTSASLLTVMPQIDTPAHYGVSSINIYTYWNATSVGTTSLWFNPRHFLNTYAASGATSSTFYIGVGVGEVSRIWNNEGALSKSTDQDFLPLGATIVKQTYPYYVQSLSINVFAPKFLEIHQEKLFAFGFSTAPSTFVYSKSFEPEAFPPEQFEDVRTNDGDYLTAAKSWNDRLYVFKKNSFHVYVGNDFENYELQEISSEYGCLNHKCIVNTEKFIAFLDQKGVIIWNGATHEELSFKVQPIFDTMNYQAALTEACMVHDKLRNQILCAIPVNGATLNNLTMVYDYKANAWARQNGYNASVFARIRGRNLTENAFYGSYSGVINWFGASFTTHNGQGFTTSFKPRFLHEMGDSVEKQFRQLYLNADIPQTSKTFNVNFYQDYGSSIVLGTTLVLDGFQNRIDFGIPAKSVTFELINYQTSELLKINGFTMKYRKQRNT